MNSVQVRQSERGAVFIWQAIIAVLIITIAGLGLIKSLYQGHEMLNKHSRRMRALEALHNEMEYWKMRGFSTQTQLYIPHLPAVPLDKQKRSRLDWIMGRFEPQGRFITAPETANLPLKAWIIELHMTWEEPDGSLQHESLRTAINSLL
ncbi:MAG: hypothetical protein ISR91_05955 [Candidatus Delongbacteria bacterium]|nr:hypothetical protein [Candidatus Delongbacteria bacterium]